MKKTSSIIIEDSFYRKVKMIAVARGMKGGFGEAVREALVGWLEANRHYLNEVRGKRERRVGMD